LENFPISGVPISSLPELIRALACVKQACALANRDLGLLSPAQAEAIITAAQEIREGSLSEDFVVDVIQGGAGTSTNMNMNEVIANRSLELLGHEKGEYEHLHPLDHVNRCQSTNDVYPTGANLGLHNAAGQLVTALETVAKAMSAKADEFRSVIKMGRTQLQDAVPMTLGQEFAANAATIREDCDRLREAQVLLLETHLGGTAIGTGLNAHPGYRQLAFDHLKDLTCLPLVQSPDLIEATQDAGAYVQLSGVLKRIAVKLSKICNDLRLLSSGPRAGLGELRLPPVQAGSSMMPGKVNPVIPEVINQIAFEVVGNDVTVTMAAEAGQLQLNAFEPVIVHKLFQSMHHLARGCEVLAERCIRGIEADRAGLLASVEASIGLSSTLVPHLGYEASATVAHEALTTGRSVREVVLQHDLLTAAQLDALLDPLLMLRPVAVHGVEQ
jgi:aspartate ammonia-lyase